MANRYPDYIMAMLRERLGLKYDDTSRDSEINAYTPNEAFEEVLNWEGICGYARIKGLIESIYGIDLNNVKPPTETEEPKEFTCVDCPYHWKEEYEDYPSCHYEGEDGYAPCSYEEPEKEPDYYDYE